MNPNLTHNKCVTLRNKFSNKEINFQNEFKSIDTMEVTYLA